MILPSASGERHGLKPSWPALHGTDLLSSYHVGFADDPDHLSLIVDDKPRADVVLDEQSGATSITLVSGFTARTLRAITSIVFMNVFLQSGQAAAPGKHSQRR
jgi:hypothetical protein